MKCCVRRYQHNIDYLIDKISQELYYEGTRFETRQNYELH
jgi:hypothetical protein